MCFSRIYLEEMKKDTLVFDEAATVLTDDTSVTVKAMLGEEKKFENYAIQEIDLLEHYIVLSKRSAAANVA